MQKNNPDRPDRLDLGYTVKGKHGIMIDGLSNTEIIRQRMLLKFD